MTKLFSRSASWALERNRGGEIWVLGQVQTTMAASASDDQLDAEDYQVEDEEGLLRYYFYRGFEYEEIRTFLCKYHGKDMSISTLKSYGLSRRHPDYNVESVREAMKNIVDGPGCLRGYRSVWHSLQLLGMRVPRIVVQELLREIDPEGTEIRKAHRLKRRIYHNPGPNYAWHCDGYDKLKPFGFPIHGCIDGWSRKILWLYVTRSNNQPNNVATYYLDAMEKFDGCPIDLVTDLGTENGTMAAIQSFFRDDENSHRYVPSPRNQRIEAWWGLFRKASSSFWMNLFKDLVDEKSLETTSVLDMECLWHCFSSVLQNELDEVKEHWNTHYIRKSRHDTINGRPDSLYFLPELHGGASNLLLTVQNCEMEYARSHVVENDEENEYQEYFHYLIQNCNLKKPENWKEALQLSHILRHYSRNGSF